MIDAPASIRAAAPLWRRIAGGIAVWSFVILAGALIGGLFGESFDPADSVGPAALVGVFVACCLRLFVFAPGLTVLDDDHPDEVDAYNFRY